MLVVIYIPPGSNDNRSEVRNELYHYISEQQTDHPDTDPILVGDFNHADPKSMFPKLPGHISFPTWGNNILDNVYTLQKS